MTRRSSLLTAVALACGVSLVAQTATPDISFDTNADLLKTPAGVYVGEVAGVGANTKGQIFVYTRTGHPFATLGDNRTFMRGGSRLFQFDPAGKFVRELGQDVYGFNMAIGLRVDPQDNVWTMTPRQVRSEVRYHRPSHACIGRKPENITVRPAQPRQGEQESRQQAERRAAGGRRAEGGGGGGGGRAAGSGTPGSSFSQPSDVAWDRAGNIYVADGIGNTNRIAKFDKDGRFIAHWGSTGTGQGQFMGVKAIAIDAQDNVYAADAGNKRIQVFDAQGAFKSEFSNVGSPRTMCMTRGSTQYSTSRTWAMKTAWRTRRSIRCSSTAKWSGDSGPRANCRSSSASLTPSTVAAIRRCSSAR